MCSVWSTGEHLPNISRYPRLKLGVEPARHLRVHPHPLDSNTCSNLRSGLVTRPHRRTPATEPLEPLARAVAAELERLHVRAVIEVDFDHGMVIIEGLTNADLVVLLTGFRRARVKADSIGGGAIAVWPS